MRDPNQTGNMMPQQPDADYSQLYGWGGVAVAALIFLGLSWDTALHHFAVGLLIALIALLVVMALFEGIWRAAVHALRSMGFEIEG